MRAWWCSIWEFGATDVEFCRFMGLRRVVLAQVRGMAGEGLSRGL